LKLTDRAVSALESPTDRTDYWDSDLTGFGLRVRPSGRKSWLAKWNGGYLSLGTYPAVNAAQARRAAHSALARAALGIAPQADETPPQTTVCELWARYVERAEGGERRNREGIGRLYVLPAFSGLAVEEIKSLQIDTLVRSLSNKPRTGTAVKRHLHGAFELAKILNMFPEERVNPAAKVKAYPYKPRTRYLTDSELQKVGEALRNVRFELLHCELITLLLYTGARVGELVSAKWDMVDFENPAIILHKHKTDSLGVKRIELGHSAFEILRNLPRFSDYIFFGRGGVGKITEATRPLAVVRSRANLAHFTIHDLRRTFASAALNDGLAPHDIGILLGHREISATGIYAIADIKRRQELIARAESSIIRRLS